MGFFTLAFVAVLCLVGGAAAAWFVFRQPDGAGRPAISPRAIIGDRLPFCESVDALAAHLHAALGAHANMELIGVYASRDGVESLDAIWRADGDRIDLPLAAPATILLQIGGAKLIDAEELAKGLRPGLPAVAPHLEASAIEAARVAEAAPEQSESLYENPFELEDESLTDSVAQRRPPEPGPATPMAPPVDDAAIAARLAAIGWQGPFGWQGLLVARPLGGEAPAALDRASDVAEVAGIRLGAICEVVASRAGVPDSAANVPQTAVVRQQPSAPLTSPAIAAPPQITGLANAERRLAEALQSPRREPDVIRAAVSLIAEGLSADRCYAIEVEGLHTRPVGHERKIEEVSSAIGLDFGHSFIQALQMRAGSTIKAILPDPRQLADMFPDVARSSLGPALRLMIPVLEKGRIVLVFVAERIRSHEPWTPEEIAFGERVAARAAVARDRIRQFDALAEQAAHARVEQDEIAEALNQIQALVTAMPDALVGLDADGRVTFANRAASKIFQRPEFDLIGKWLAELGADFGHDVAVWEQVLVAEETQQYVIELGHSTPPVYFDMSVVPGLDSHICNRLITLAPHHPAAPGLSVATHESAREMSAILARLLGHAELIAGGGDLSGSQSAALDQVHRLGADLRARLDQMLRGK